MDLEKLLQELEDAKRFRQHRAAFGSIVRRYIKEIDWMTSDEKRDWLRDLELSSSYQTEIAKELSVWKYDKERKK